MKSIAASTEFQPDLKYAPVNNIRRINFIRDKIKDHNIDR